MRGCINIRVADVVADGRTPLVFASLRGYTSVIELLLKKGAEVDHGNRENGATALMAAACRFTPLSRAPKQHPAHNVMNV